MPELPEVEAARRAIHDHCVGKKIKSAVVADDPKVIEGVTVSDFEAALVGKTILTALRKGKNLWLQLDSPPFPSFQFGMAGAVYIKGVAITKYKRSAVESEEWPSKYSKVFIELEDGVELSFTDKRRFARVRLLKDPATVPPISELGPDALLEPMAVKEFTEALSKKKTVIKALLLDQSFVAGIGNWIADEVLYQARIHPQEVAANLSKESCANLHNCIKEVIEKAVEVGADSNQYPSDWIFHSREKKPGKAFVDGKKIEFITAGGRTTAYVPELQKNSSGAAGKSKKQIPKRKKGSSSDEDGPESGEEEGGESVKLNSKMQKPDDGGRGRKSTVQGKFKEIEEGSDEDEDGGGGKRKVSKKMAEKKQAPNTTAKKGNHAAAAVSNRKRNSRVKK